MKNKDIINNIELITQSMVLEMGFTKTMIKKLLPEPIEKENPYYKCASPMKLYDKAVVLAIMETEPYKEEWDKALKRKESANKAVKTKKDSLLTLINEISKSINVELVDDKELVEQAINSYKNHQMEIAMWHEDYERMFEIEQQTDYPIEFIRRIVVNHIRHNLTTYDDELELLYNKVGKAEAYKILKNAVLNKIADKYPKYAQECKNQLVE